ncbi:MAG TPA: C40 family peptidase [Pyrinomonadaceae bacterium]|nr:C40 family peptidase [Pyrinomonadaceae bacterium]
MSLSRIFPRALAVCFALSLTALNASAQTSPTRPRTVGGLSATTTTTDAAGRARLENEPHVVSTADEAEAEPPAEAALPLIASRAAGLGSTERVMLGAIEERLGTPYRLGTEGPSRYDCSGFVWSVFQSAGIPFERGSARTLWSSFEPAGEEDKFKFGTLVFFNGLRHVGIVADAEGFYHASTSRGVVYSRFGEYWSKRITGFRRVPLGQSRTLIASAGR